MLESEFFNLSQTGVEVADIDNGRTYQLATILIDQDLPSFERELLERQLTEELERVRASVVNRLAEVGPEFLPASGGGDSSARVASVGSATVAGGVSAAGGAHRAIREALNEPINLETRQGVEQALSVLTRIRRQLEVAASGVPQTTAAAGPQQGNLLEAQEHADQRISRPEQPFSIRPSVALQQSPNQVLSVGGAGGAASSDGFPGVRVVSLLQQAGA